jgi:YidC/Oxa1 family membrane protein insertase
MGPRSADYGTTLMFQLIATILAWFYDLVPSFAFSIVMLTLVVMVVVTPLTMKGTRSMIKMQHLQPEMKKIQTRFKGDKERMNKELMAFYQANGINPMGGCLPLIVQAPVFIVLYNVLRGLTRRLSDIGEGVGWVAGRLAADLPLQGAPTGRAVFYPDYLAADSRMFLDLSEKTEMVSWGVDLSRSASGAMALGLVTALPYFFLILVVFASSWIQQKQIRGRNTGTQVNSQQQMIMKIMPFFLPLISINLDAALVLYFVISNLYRIGQQSYITRKLYGPDSHLPVVVPSGKGDKDGRDEKSGQKSSAGKKSSAGRKPPSSTGSPPARSSAAAKRGRTRAGVNRNQSQSTGLKASSETTGKASGPVIDRKGWRRRGPSDDRTGSAEDSKKVKKKVKDSKRAKGSEKAKGSRDSGTKDKRPPAARNGGGRTTPPGTAWARGAKKKRRK